MDKPTHNNHPSNPRAAEALQRAEEDRLRRQAEERLSLENPPRQGIDLATHQVTQGNVEVSHPRLHLGDINAEVNKRVQEQAGSPQVAGFQAINRSSNETGHALNPILGPTATPASHQDVDQPGRPDSPRAVRVTPPMGYFPLPSERSERIRPSPTPPRMMPMALPRALAPPTPVSQAVHSSQESEDALEEKAHKMFKQVTIHTAKCDVCNRHNKATLHRCVDCGWQICTPCWDARGGNGEHFPRRKFNGPTFGGGQLKKDKGKAKEIKKGQPKTPDSTPRVRTPQTRMRSTPLRTPKVQTRNTAVRSAQPVQQPYLEPGRESKGHETDDTLSCTDENDNRPPTRGKGKAMGRVDEDGDVAMSGMPPVETPQPDSEEKRRLDAAIGLLMLGGHVPRDPPPVQAPGSQYYPQTPFLNRPAEDTHPNPTYRDLSTRAAARFDALLAAAELVLGPGSSTASATDAQTAQGNQYAQASHSSQAGPAAQTYAANSTPAQMPAVSQSPTHQIPMGPPRPPGHPYGQAHPENGQAESIDTGSHPEMSRQQPPPQPAPTNQARPNAGSHPAAGARRGIPARAAATRRTLPVPEHPDPLWTPEWFNTMAEHLTMLQRIGLAPQDREFTRLNPAPQAPAPEIPPNAVYERRYDQWLTPEAEARARAAAAILRGEVPISTVGVPGFGHAQGDNQNASAVPASGPLTAAYHNADPSADISNVNMPPAPAGPSNTAATSLFGNSTTTAAPLDQDHNVVIPARRPASDTFSTNPHDPKRQVIETATGIEAVSVSGPRVPTPVSMDQARDVTQIPGLGGHVDEDVMEVDSGQGRSDSKSRGRAWEL